MKRAAWRFGSHLNDGQQLRRFAKKCVGILQLFSAAREHIHQDRKLSNLCVRIARMSLRMRLLQFIQQNFLCV